MSVPLLWGCSYRLAPAAEFCY